MMPEASNMSLPQGTRFPPDQEKSKHTSLTRTRTPSPPMTMDPLERTQMIPVSRNTQKAEAAVDEGRTAKNHEASYEYYPCPRKPGFAGGGTIRRLCRGTTHPG